MDTSSLQSENCRGLPHDSPLRNLLNPSHLLSALQLWTSLWSSESSGPLGSVSASKQEFRLSMVTTEPPLHNDWHVQVASLIMSLYVPRGPACPTRWQACYHVCRRRDCRLGRAVKNLANLLHHELALRLVSSTLPAVGIALSAAVGPLFSPAVSSISFTSCKSAPFLCGFAQRLCATFATSLLGASCAVLMALHKPPAIALSSVASREALFSTSCPSVHVLTLVLSSARCFTCCAWSAGPQHHSPPPRATRGRCPLLALAVHVHVASLLWSAPLFYFGFRVAIPPNL